MKHDVNYAFYKRYWIVKYGIYAYKKHILKNISRPFIIHENDNDNQEVTRYNAILDQLTIIIGKKIMPTDKRITPKKSQNPYIRGI